MDGIGRHLDGLTERQRKFVNEYMKEPNGKRAAIAAGYSPAGAEVSASRLLRHPRVQEYLRGQMKRVEATALVDATWVLRRLRRVAVRCTSAENFDAAGANRALELLGKHLAMFVDRTAHQGPDGGPIEIRIVDLGAESPEPDDDTPAPEE
jgi:phage terminase small subunit